VNERTDVAVDRTSSQGRLRLLEKNASICREICSTNCARCAGGSAGRGDRPATRRAVRQARRTLPSTTFPSGSEKPGQESAVGPAERYRVALVARDRACKASNAGKLFAELPDNDKDAVLSGSKARNRSSTERMGKRSLRKRSETCKLAFSPIKSTAAIVTWSPGK
jgi:hypothetical protein